MVKNIRIIVKILLCASLIVTTGLVLNYIRNLNPTADGFDVTNIIARLIHGDDYWTWGKLTTGVCTSASVFVLLFCVDNVLNMFGTKKK